ncbi:hypothetical protein DFJ43DRAFT_1100310 [Lentinula guzmanii]|uniref:Secreted protein n=1 Tax=Lentinula guzmanii TaxID=2804957 RepID=A0AA38MVG1_9AGAR|nr:hypothetical protein DFJ43DRAFT_1100310 [Lentinula guzmanii]
MRRKFAVFLSIMIMLGQGCRNRNFSIQWIRHHYGDYGCCLLFVQRTLHRVSTTALYILYLCTHKLTHAYIPHATLRVSLSMLILACSNFLQTRSLINTMQARLDGQRARTTYACPNLIITRRDSFTQI